MKKSDKMRKLMAHMAAQPAKKKAKKKKKAAKADKALDANQDGKVDEKDASLFEKAAEAVKKTIRKKQD